MFRHLFRDRSAASAVEFALLLPVLITLLFGIMFGASVFNTQQTVTQAAREAARFGATLPLSAGGEGANDQFPPSGGWFDLVEERAQSVLANDAPLTLGGIEPTVCVAFTDGESVATNGECPAEPIPTLDGTPRVRVIASRPARIELGVATVGPFTLSASGLGRFEPEIVAPTSG